MTPKQRNLFFALAAKAWSKAGAGPDRETWRRDEMFAAIQCRSTSTVSRRSRYEILMLHFAVLAQDFDAIGYWSVAAERRLRFVLQAIAADLSHLQQRGVTDAYMEAIYHQAGHPAYTTIDDIPQEHLYLVIEIADSHVRRLRKAAGLQPADLPSSAPPWNIRGYRAALLSERAAPKTA